MNMKKIVVAISVAIIIITGVITIPAIFNFSPLKSIGADKTPVFTEINNIHLSNGKYYLDNDIENCYFLIYDNKIQLIADEMQLKKLFIEQMSITNTELQINDENYLAWLSAEKDRWKIALPYKVVQNSMNNNIIIIWHWTEDDNGNIKSFTGTPYVDENTISYGQCGFIHESVNIE